MNRRTVIAIGTILFVAALIGDRLAPEEDDDRSKRPTPQPAHVVHCGPGSAVPAPRPTSRDAVLGPVTLVAFRREFERAKESELLVRGPAGVRALKMPVVFGGTRDMTIAVPQRYRQTLGLTFDTAARGVDTVAEAKPAVRFRACRGDAATGHPGELLYGGPWPACVALEITPAGRARTTHALSLGAGPCGVPK